MPASKAQSAIGTTTNGTTCTATLASGATSGNHIVALMACNRGSTNAGIPSGFTEVGRQANGTGNNLAVAYKVSTGGETGISFTATLGNSRMVLIVMEISGGDITNVSTLASFNTSSGAVAMHTTPSENATGLAIGAVSVLGVANGETWGSWSDSYTADKQGDAAASTNNQGLANATKSVSAATTTTKTWTTSGNTVGFTWIIENTGGLIQDSQDDAGLSDSISISQTHSLTNTDDVGLSDTITLAQTHNHSAQDEVTLTDSFTVVLALSVEDSDTAGLSDTIDVVIAQGVAETDSISLSDTFVIELVEGEPPPEDHDYMPQFGYKGEGPGGGSVEQRVITGADPAATTEISETVPATKQWELLAIRFTLVTSATVANRRVQLVIDDGSSILTQIVAFADQAASLTRNYNGAVFTDVPATQPVASDFYLPLPNPLYLLPGYRIRTVTSGIQTGDNFSAPVLVVAEHA